MAETIKIEIPVSVQDKTDPSLSNITRKLNSMAQASQKVSKMMMGTAGRKTGLEKSLEKMDRNLQKNHQIEITAHDNATPVLSEVEDRATRVSGASAEIEVGASDNATGVMGSVEDQASGLNGSTADVEVGAEDNATGIMNDVEDAAAALDGESSEIEIGAEDNATGVMNDVEDAAAALNGESSEVELSAEDNATPVINEVDDALAGLDGSTATVNIQANNEASGVIQNVAGGGISAVGAGYAAAKGGIAAAAGFAGVSMGIGSALSAFSDFESGMSEVRAISGATEEQFASLAAKAKYMGSTTKFTASEAAEGLKYMAMAGWKPEQMEAGLEGIMNLAAASGESLGTTSDIVTDALTAFGMGAEQSTHFADILAEASSDSNTNVGIMGESFKYAAPLMGAMGYSAEDTATALGLMANAGIKGSMAGTTLRTAISNLAAPTKQMREGMEKYGISLTDEEGKMKSLKGVMDNVRESLGGLSEDEQAAAVKTIFGKQAMSGMLAIINAEAGAYDELYDNIQNAEGAAERMKDIMLDNLQGSMTLLSSAWEGVQDTFGERVSPYLRKAIDGITEALPGASNAISNYMDKVDQMTSSSAWKNAGAKGKINMAWDTMVAAPFQKWAGTKGKNMISAGITSMFTSAGKVLSGRGELTDWLETALLGVGALKGISGVTSIMSGLGSFATTLSGLGGVGSAIGGLVGGLSGALPVIAGVTAGIVALNAAMNTITQKQVEASLAVHFGDIELSEEQISQVADNILDAEWVTNVKLALGEIENLDGIRGEAEQAIADSEAIIYNAQVRTQMHKEQGQDPYVEAFANALQGEVEAYAESNHIPYNALADVVLNPSTDGEGGGTMQTLEDYANEIVASYEGTLSETYDPKVGVKLTPEQESGFLSEVEAAINADIEASYAANGWEYDDTAKIKLTPEESGDILALLKTTIEGKLAEKMSPSPEYEQEVLAVLTPNEQADYKSEIDTFITNAIAAIEKEPQEAKILVDTILQTSDGKTLSEKISAWALEDEIEMSSLGDELSSAVDQALSDGIMTVDESRHIAELQNKMNAIMSGWRKAQAQASFDLFDQQMEGLTGKELSAGTYQSIIAAMQEKRAANDAYLDEASLQFYSYLNQWDADGRLAAAGLSKEGLTSDWRQAVRNARAEELNNAVGYELNTVGGENGVYADLVAENQAELAKEAQKSIDFINSEYQSGVSNESLQNDLENHGSNMYKNVGWMSSDDQKALSSLYETMKPEAQAVGELIDEYTAVGQKVPQELMDSYNSAMQLGAASGDIDAGWAVFASQLAESGDKAMVKGIMDGSVSAPEELRDALSRAMAETTDEPFTMDEVQAQIDGAKVTEESEAAVQQSIEDFMDAISSSGSDVEVTADGMQITLGEVEIDDQSAAEQVAEALGMTMDELASAAGVTTAELEAGATITIPQENITMDTSAIQQATQAAADAEEPSDIEQTANANTTVEEGETDTSAVEQGVQEALDGMEDWDTDGQANVELSQTNNVDAIYSEVDGEITSKFAGGFSATAPVSITLSYSITNPSANISLGGSASGSGTVTATVSANGRYVDGPLLSWVGEDGPEFIIPVGSERRARGMELWQQAGEALGVPGFADGGIVGGGIPIFSSDDDDSFDVSSKDAGDGISPEISNGGNGGVTVQINLSPEFNLNDANENNVLAMIRAHMKELADDLGYEISEMLNEAYENRPVA